MLGKTSNKVSISTCTKNNFKRKKRTPKTKDNLFLFNFGLYYKWGITYKTFEAGAFSCFVSQSMYTRSKLYNMLLKSKDIGEVRNLRGTYPP